MVGLIAFLLQEDGQKKGFLKEQIMLQIPFLQVLRKDLMINIV
jgi:hypothetical protein